MYSAVVRQRQSILSEGGTNGARYRRDRSIVASSSGAMDAPQLPVTDVVTPCMM